MKLSGDCVGRPGDLGFKQVMYTRGFRKLGALIVPFNQELMTLSVTEQRQIAETLRGIGSQGRKQVLEMSKHPLHSRRSKQVRGVLERKAKPAALVSDFQTEIEL